MNRDFILELATLLQKYDASIDFNFDHDCGCNDSSDETFTVCFGVNSGSRNLQDEVLSNSSCIDAKNLFKALCMNDKQWKSYIEKGLQPLL